MTEKKTIDTNASTSMNKLLPVLFTFFVMGFCDVVGVAKNHLIEDGLLTISNGGYVSIIMFVWFLLAVPIAIMMNRIGRKRTVQLSNVITILGMIIPMFSYNLVSMLTAFAMLGIGNTILQVSLNPLMQNVVKGDKLASSLTTGQFIKAISSFSGAPIALLAATLFGSWHYIFPIFAAITLIAAVWLQCTHIAETEPAGKASIGGTFSLLGDKTILLLFLGIIAVVGADVGMNTAMPDLLKMNGVEAKIADFGSTAYFLGRTIGAFVGAILLARISEKQYFRTHILLALAAVCVFFFMHNATAIFIVAAVVAYGISSIFAVIFSQALKARPDKGNEMSGLMITGIVGGAVVGFLCNLAIMLVGNETGSIWVVALFVLYLVICSFILKFK